MNNLTQLELITLTAIMLAGDGAYGIEIHKNVRKLAPGRAISQAGVYTALGRLEQDGLCESLWSEPEQVRGGRSRRYYRLTAPGIRSIHATLRFLTKISNYWL